MAKKIKREELLNLIKYYEQAFFTNDLPIPFKYNLTIYPILVENYYKFYASIGCFKINKNEDIKGVGMSNLDYVLYLSEQEDGKRFFFQLISLLELIFHIKNGIICPECGKVISYEEINEKIDKIKLIENENERNNTMQLYIEQIEYCDCNKDNKIKREPVIQYSREKGNKYISINGIKINSEEYDLLRNIVLYYNIPDYDDEYIDPELKAELEEVARLKNPNNVQPSLEKQMSCIVSAGVSYTYETIKQLSIRKMVLLLRTIDARLHYFAYRQAEASGFVSFKNELTHWIYGVDKKDKFSDVMTMDALRDKLKDVI